MTEQVVWITGAAKRLGAATARLLHQQGYRVIIHYRHSGEAAELLAAECNALRPDSCVTIQADLQDIDGIEELVTKAAAHWGRLDCLVNNASVFYPERIEATTSTSWDTLMTANLKAPFFLAKASLPYLKQHQGCIVNFADIHGMRPLKNYPVYSITKAGMIMLTQALAQESGVRVNAIAPGAILWPEMMEEGVQERILERIPLGTSGAPEDIAKAVLYLIRDASYVNGQILAVDGGRSSVSQ
jgi:pteridine reductase